MPEPVMRAEAHAKVNLVLEVLGVRDDGYHEIDTVLQELELCDTVTLRAAANWAVSAFGPLAVGTPDDQTNLALRAAMRLAECVSGWPLAIHLEKRIPAAGGLGGGASDAAAVLRLLQPVWRASDEQIRAVANSLGSDEAFFLIGGTARAQGRGERVTALEALPPHDVVVFVPGETIERKTARMFAALDRHPFDSGSVAAMFPAEPPSRLTSGGVFNAFERVAFELFPWLASLWEDLEARTSQPVRLAGAGPCLFWMGAPGSGGAIAAAADGARCRVIPTRTAARS